MRKISKLALVAILALLLLFVFAACKKADIQLSEYEVHPNDEIDIAAVIDNLVTENPESYGLSEKISLPNLHTLLENAGTTINPLSFDLGLFRISNVDQENFVTTYGVYSALKDKTVVKPEYDYVSLENASYSDYRRYYVRARVIEDGVTKYMLTNTDGTTLLEKNNYTSAPTVSLQVVKKYDPAVGTTDYEKFCINYTLGGEETTLEAYYLLDENGARVEIDSIPGTEYAVGDLITNELIEGESMGLDGYYILNESINGKNITTVFDSENNKVSQFVYSANISEIFALDGKIIYQTLRQVPDDYSDYTAFVGDNKVKLNTYIFDLRNGNEIELGFNYYIMSVSNSVENEDDIPIYAVIKVYGIENKLLANDFAYMLIDSNGKFVHNVDRIYIDFDYIYKLKEDRYLYVKGSEKRILDGDLNEISDLTSFTAYENLTEEVIVLRDNYSYKYGAIDFDGSVIVPFVYTTKLDFAGGWAYGHNEELGKNVRVSKENTVVSAPTESQAEVDETYYGQAATGVGILYSVTKEVIGLEINPITVYRIEVLNYAGDVLATYYKSSSISYLSTTALFDGYYITTHKYLLVLDNVIVDTSAFDQETGVDNYSYRTEYLVLK